MAKWCTAAANESTQITEALGDQKIAEFLAQKKKAVEARSAANAGADKLFANDPLVGVGHSTWRVMWEAAKEYSTKLAYPGKTFPVIPDGETATHCVMCQQPLSPEGAERLQRFQSYVDGALAKAADAAELGLQEAKAVLPRLEVFAGKDWVGRVDQVKKRNDQLATALEEYKATAIARLQKASAVLAVGTPDGTSVPQAITAIDNELIALAGTLTVEADAMTAAEDSAARAKLATEAASLTDRKLLATNKGVLIQRRDLLKQDECYEQALADLNTKGITQEANKLVDTHLTTAVLDQFEVERATLDIKHLKIGLARKSGQTKAAFQTDTGVKLAKASDILSEGEQRALALSAFLTEISVMPGKGPIIVDDPISSLDRERGMKVAERLAQEAAKRQVVVFTHDLIFFNDLCRAAEDKVDVKTIALFSDGGSAGQIDPAGVAWLGLPVKKRLNLLRSEFAQVRKLANSSPTQYELQTKHLYSRLRDAYERMVEEMIFCDVVRRGVDRVETQKLRYVHLSDALAVRFHDGMTKANTYSHDNPAAATVAIPKPDEVDADFDYFQKLMEDLKAESDKTETNRPSMKKK